MASPVKRDPESALKEETLDIDEIYDGKQESYRVPRLSSSPPPSDECPNRDIRLLPLPGANCRRCIECSAHGNRIRRSHHICSKCNQGVHKMCFPNHQFKCGIFLVADGSPVRFSNRSTYLPSFNRHDVNLKDDNSRVTVVDDRLRCYYCTFKTLWKRILIEHIRFNHLRYVRHPGLLKPVVKQVRAPKRKLAAVGSRLIPPTRWTLNIHDDDSSEEREDDDRESSDDGSSESFTLPIELNDDSSDEEDFTPVPRIDLGECRRRILSSGLVEEIKRKGEPQEPPVVEKMDIQTSIVISDDEPYTEAEDDAIRKEFGGLVVLAGVDTEEEDEEEDIVPASSSWPQEEATTIKGDPPQLEPVPEKPEERIIEELPQPPTPPPLPQPPAVKPKVKLGQGAGGRRKCSPTGTIMHKCDWCKYASSRRYNVRTHMKRRHTKEYLEQRGVDEEPDEEDTAKLKLYLTRGKGAPYTCTVVGADSPAAP